MDEDGLGFVASKGEVLLSGANLGEPDCRCVYYDDCEGGDAVNFAREPVRDCSYDIVVWDLGPRNLRGIRRVEFSCYESDRR